MTKKVYTSRISIPITLSKYTKEISFENRILLSLDCFNCKRSNRTVVIFEDICKSFCTPTNHPFLARITHKEVSKRKRQNLFSSNYEIIATYIVEYEFADFADKKYINSKISPNLTWSRVHFETVCKCGKKSHQSIQNNIVRPYKQYCNCGRVLYSEEIEIPKFSKASDNYESGDEYHAYMIKIRKVLNKINNKDWSIKDGPENYNEELMKFSISNFIQNIDVDLLSAVGNNHRGTYHSIFLTVLPFVLDTALKTKVTKQLNWAIGLLMDWYSFDLELGNDEKINLQTFQLNIIDQLEKFKSKLSVLYKDPQSLCYKNKSVAEFLSYEPCEFFSDD